VLLFGLVGPFAAALQARYGLVRVTVSCLLVISAGAFATTQMTRPWHMFALWGVVVGVGTGGLATVFASTVASRWFVARRGLVVGALTAATASGQLIFLPLLTRLADGVGWRWVGFTVACSSLAVVPLVALFLRDSPESMGLAPYGAPPDHRPPEPMTNPVRTAFEGLTLARRSGAFWLLWGSFFVCGLSTNGLIQTHFISAAGDHDITSTDAAGYLVLIGGFDVVGTIASGWLTDRYDARRLLLAYYALRGLSLLVLHDAFEAGNLGLAGFMIFYGLDWVATVPPTVALCNELFGRTRAPVVYGWVFAGHQVGAAVAAWGAGAIRDTTGSYHWAFTIGGVACLFAAYGVTRIATGPQIAETRPDLEPHPALT
jgi:MFS family permease